MGGSHKINKLLIANRGEIACRIILTARKMGIKTIAVHSEADQHARHVQMADEAYHIGPSPASESYLVASKILDVAKTSNADAIHPGYGFLSENAGFADACKDAGIIFIGPSSKSIESMGLKDAAKVLMEKAKVPVVPGYHGEKQDLKTLSDAADKIGYPVLIKAVAGGGGKGMRRVDDPKKFKAELESAQRESKASFGDDRVLVEKYILKPRHIEIQVFGDNFGDVVHLFERDCSIQRRHQKILEESPAPGMPQELRDKMGEAAVKAAKAINYSGAGTVEFIVDSSKGLENAGFYFMEMNTRLQVEHPVTEMVTGQDLVEWQILVAEGNPLPKAQKDLRLSGHSIEARLYAEDPYNGFLPATGRLLRFKTSEPNDNFRLETGINEGDEVSVFYDPMIAKLVVHEDTREKATDSLKNILRDLAIAGLQTNQSFLLNTLETKDFVEGDVHTGFIESQGPSLLEKTFNDKNNHIAMATLAYLLNRRDKEAAKHNNSPEPNSPWNNLDGFRLNLPATEKISLGFEEQVFEITIETKAAQFEISFEGYKTLISGDLLENNTLSASLDGHDVSINTCFNDETVYLMGGGTTFEYKVIPQIQSAVDDLDGPGTVVAPMPGRILDILVKVGDKVSLEDPLVIMEAMKMEYTLRAGKDGVISEIRTSIDDQVKDGDPVVSVADAE